MIMITLIAGPAFSRTSQGKAQVTNKTLYFVLDRENRWCGYSDGTKWKAEVRSSESDTPVAQVDYANGRLSTVYVTQQDSAGDWSVFDTYSVNTSGNLNSLKRLIKFAPGRLNEEEVWLIENGKATKQLATHRNIVTLEPMPLTAAQLRDMFLPEIAITSRVQDFPFWSLVRDKRADILAKGKVCILDRK
jgi:hypothetical protein